MFPKRAFHAFPRNADSGLGSDIASLQKSSLCLSWATPPPSMAQQVDHSVITSDCGLLKDRDHAFFMSVLLAADSGLLGTVSR